MVLIINGKLKFNFKKFLKRSLKNIILKVFSILFCIFNTNYFSYVDWYESNAINKRYIFKYYYFEQYYFKLLLWGSYKI